MKYKKGNLTIFTSYTPGAGKSYYMVEKAVERSRLGQNVVIGFLNAEHRDVEQIIKDHHIRRTFRKKYSIKTLLEMKPDLVLMDEMGMSGVNRDRKSFVYQDILKLLNEGIDVFATANLKRFYSINPKFYEITKIKIRKTIPDELLKIADKIYFIDRTPEQMREDFELGKVFDSERMQSRIMKKNFNPENLIAYRRLSLDILMRDYEEKVEIYERK